MTEEFTTKETDTFREAVHSLKLYRRAELVDERGRVLIRDLYVDPLPDDHVLKTCLKPNTTFLIGRKGTGKSTIFQKIQQEVRDSKDKASVYIDIKTTFESSQVDEALLNRLKQVPSALSPQALERILLYRSFIRSIIVGIKDELKKKARKGFLSRVGGLFSSSHTDLFERLDAIIEDADGDQFFSVIGIKQVEVSEGQNSARTEEASAEVSASLSPTGANVGASVKASEKTEEASTQGTSYSDLLMRTFSIKDFVSQIKSVLDQLSIKHLYILIDDFSELSEEAMEVVVDTMLAPLNNWSDEFIKFKVAAYPNRVYLGDIDKSKIDEINIDPYRLYGNGDTATMEGKAIDFCKRLIEHRIKHFCKCDLDRYFDSADDQVWETCFFASMGNPRVLGYLLYYALEGAILYGKKINSRVIKDASRRYYEQKIEPYFHMNKFLHESFSEKSSVHSLRELLEDIIKKSREIRQDKTSPVITEVEGRAPTSHFHLVTELEPILNSLELNFFLTKYHERSDKDGRKVSIFCLNFGLCQKYQIEFGCPDNSRRNSYFVERIFDFSPLIKMYVEMNQEIVCDSCGVAHGLEKLDAIKMFDMMCPNCKTGTCKVINLSKKYGAMLREVDSALLLPSAEIQILQTLNVSDTPMFAADIAGEMDCSYQLVGVRGKYLAERGLVNREFNSQSRREFKITDQGKSTYFNEDDSELLYSESSDSSEATDKNDSESIDQSSSPAKS